MSFPYPQDRHRDRVDKGEQPYQDAREALSQQDANLPEGDPEGRPEPPTPSSLSGGGTDIPADVLDELKDAGDAVDRRGRDESKKE